MPYATLIGEYFSALDSSLDRLSSMHEGRLIGLPSWAHTTRRITVGISSRGDGIAINVVPDKSLIHDHITTASFGTRDELNAVLSTMHYEGPPLESFPVNEFVMLSGMQMIEANNPLAVPLLDDQGLIGWGRSQGFSETFSLNKAMEDAISFWNTAQLGEKSSSSYVIGTQRVVDRLCSIIKRKAFLERRVHRFVNDHRRLLLPSHRRCLFEHPLSNGNELRKADFILEREAGMSPLLIELESPVHTVFTKQMGLTAVVTHACQQISDWARLIEVDPARNAIGDFSFLLGPKDRLVIVGRGLQHKEQLIETKFNGTLVWTYDLFAQQAVDRLNEAYADQCALIGLEVKRPFHL